MWFSFRQDDFDSLPDRRLIYPWIGLERVHDGFVALSNLDKLHRTEDLNLAPSWRARLGYASPTFGSDYAEAVLEAAASGGRALGAGRLLLFDASGGGRVGSAGTHDVLASGSARLIVPDFKRGNAVLWLRGGFARALDPEERMLLGGDTGLRGYPIRYAYGDRTLLAGIEQRLYGDHQFAHLFRVGAAAFAEAGQAWGGDAPADHLGLLRDVGLGLRFGSSRSAKGAMVHVDLAFPLDGVGGSSHPQFLISTEDTF